MQFEPKGTMKAQILADFLVELTPPVDQQVNMTWILSVDGASNVAGSGVGVILEGPDGVLIEQSLRFEFKASNNQAEYEAHIAGMRLAKEMGATNLEARSDSQLLTGQVSVEFQAKDPQLAKYLDKVRGLILVFSDFKLMHVPWEQNARVNLLSKLASMRKPGNNKLVI